PLPDPPPYLRAEQLVQLGLVSAESVHLFFSGAERVVTEAGDVAFERGELVLIPGYPALAEKGRLITIAGRHDRDHRLASQIARIQDRVRLVDVEPDGVEQLAPGRIGRVEVRHHVQARASAFRRSFQQWHRALSLSPHGTDGARPCR